MGFNVKDSERAKLATLVDEYIKNICSKIPNSNYNTQVNGKYIYRLSGRILVDLCVEYELDITTIMSILHHESHYGATGVKGARVIKTKNPLSWGSYDNGSDAFPPFPDVNEGLKKTLPLLANKFFPKNTWTLKQSYESNFESPVKRGQYYNIHVVNGKNYAQQIFSTRKRICEKSDIDILWQIYTKKL